MTSDDSDTESVHSTHSFYRTRSKDRRIAQDRWLSDLLSRVKEEKRDFTSDEQYHINSIRRERKMSDIFPGIPAEPTNTTNVPIDSLPSAQEIEEQVDLPSDFIVVSETTSQGRSLHPRREDFTTTTVVLPRRRRDTSYLTADGWTRQRGTIYSATSTNQNGRRHNAFTRSGRFKPSNTSNTASTMTAGARVDRVVVEKASDDEESESEWTYCIVDDEFKERK
ncbi:hypothetical protein TREMEDRAFT_60396 [Tremella mesenterica DSM 1558]|uniref:uncharacterized protein n=1 Tax=Tremella mesenterica (strain ATCC 24925 / CBS 8224 / DSM 1558 / NBRC 9311 / NRRL Y-6157 / RJB 2259-6 / UBC 559-6) TaxID=578456 RepID=UPI0003F49A57|nr:uncharacterized protein TREMEDRAFT_60396 [Tremella mesenterica DSM 1558]EIW71468.1 hypothetical protein TREMEDRAFT_60396 [Tremella mesenterica DSM 1558]